MTTHRKRSDHLHQGRQDRRIQEAVHDPYRAKGKYREPTVCPECSASMHHGRWTWQPAPAGAHEILCPACQRVRDRVPAAFLSLGGGFLAEHRDEIVRTVHNVESRQKAEHPLERIMAAEDVDGGIEMSFTDAHLARAAGEAVHHAFQGELDLHYPGGETLLRVRWHRDA
jgi:NMD protein affecting ribosome stability and mRNA decay